MQLHGSKSTYQAVSYLHWLVLFTECWLLGLSAYTMSLMPCVCVTVHTVFWERQASHPDHIAASARDGETQYALPGRFCVLPSRSCSVARGSLRLLCRPGPAWYPSLALERPTYLRHMCRHPTACWQRRSNSATSEHVAPSVVAKVYTDLASFYIQPVTATTVKNGGFYHSLCRSEAQASPAASRWCGTLTHLTNLTGVRHLDLPNGLDWGQQAPNCSSTTGSQPQRKAIEIEGRRWSCMQVPPALLRLVPSSAG